MNNKESLLKTFLVKIKEDILFIRSKEVDKSLSKQLKRDVLKIFYNNNNLLLKHLGIMKQYYTENCTLLDYYYNICKSFSKSADKDDGKKLFLKMIDNISRDVHKKIDNRYEIDDIKKALVLQIIYRTYLGFVFEELIKNILISNNFIVEHNESLDNTYKIDLLVSYNLEELKHIKIGLQLKSVSYVDISKYYKQKHLNAFNKVIEDTICKDVYYLLHDDNIQLISYNLYVENELRRINLLLSKENVCADAYRLTMCGEIAEVVEDEELLVKELLKKIYYIYLVEEDLVDNKFKIYKKMKIKKTFDSDFYNWYNSLNNKSSNKSANLEEHLVLVKDGNL